MYQEIENQYAQIYAIAAEDSIYQIWQRSYEDCRDAFAEFANSQPEEIRNMLYGYADCGRMAQQRLVNLACKYMVFPKK